MSDPEPEQQSLGGVFTPFSMTARHGRITAAVRTLQLVTIAVPLVGALGSGVPGAGGLVIVLLSLIPVLMLQLRALFRPASLALHQGDLRINAQTRLKTQPANIRHLFFNDGVGIIFRDPEQVSADTAGVSGEGQAGISAGLAATQQRSGVHVQLDGFSMGDVERLRQFLGVAMAEPGSEPADLEQYHRSLIARTPVVWVSPLLIALNVGLFAVMSAASGSLLSVEPRVMLAWGADFGPLTLDGQWWRLLTCIFLHWGCFHLLSNMWGLHQGGRVMERLAGNAGFLALYLFSGIAGSLVSIRWTPDAVCAGASGAVFGIFGALGAWHFRRRRDIPERIVREVRRSAIPFLGFNLLIGVGIPGIDQAAHIGGFAAGLLSGLILAGTRATDLQAGRRLRLLGLSCLAMLITAAGILRLPGIDEVPGLMGELQRTGKMEERLLSVYRSAALQVDSGRMSREDYAAVLRQEILPEWNQCIERLRSTSGNLPENPTVLRLIQYLQLRAESWELSAEAVETDNQELMTRSQEKWSEADRIAEQLAQEQQNP